MMLSVMVVGAGAAFSDQSKIKNTEAVDACTALNIIGGYPDGSFKPEGNITRAEVTKMICVALNGGKNPAVSTNTTPTFSDVRNNANAAWAEGYIESCAAQGIVSGVGGGKFAPNGNVTGVQMAKMLLVSLGYKSDLEGFTGNAWATNVNVRAAQKGLYKGLESMDTNAALTRDNAAQMIWNALKAYEVEYVTNLVADKDGKLSTQITVQDKMDVLNHKITLLKDKYDADITKNAGILASVKEDNKGTYTIKVAYDVTEGGQTTTKYAPFTKVSKDYSDLLGQKVDLLLNKDNEVFGVYANEDSTVVASGYVGALEKDGSNTDKVKLDGTSYKLNGKIYSSSAIVSTANEITAPAKTLATLIETDLGAKGNMNKNVAASSIKLIDNDGDGKIDAAVYTPVKVGKVTSVSKSSVTINNGINTVKFDDADVYSGIAKDDYVMFVDEANRSAKDKDSITKLDVTSAKVDGTRTGEAKVNNNWLKLASNLSDAPTTGNTYDLVVVGGVILFSEETSASSKDILYVSGTKDFDKFNGETNGTKDAKVYFTDGTSKTVTISKLNGNKLNDSNQSSIEKGVLYTYSVLSDGTYDVKVLSSSNKAGYDKVEAGSTSVYSKQKINGFAPNDDAVIFVQTKKETKVLSGKQIKNWGDDAFISSSYIYALSEKNGINYVGVAALVNDSEKNVPGATKDTLYGYLTADAYTADKNGEDKATYEVWTNEGAKTLYADTTSLMKGAVAGAVISYNVNGDYIENIAVNGNIDKEFSEVAITGFDYKAKGELSYVAPAATGAIKKGLNQTTLDDDCVFIGINDEDTAGVENATLDQVQLANAGSTSSTVLTNAYIVVGGDDNKVVAVIFDAEKNELDNAMELDKSTGVASQIRNIQYDYVASASSSNIQVVFYDATNKDWLNADEIDALGITSKQVTVKVGDATKALQDGNGGGVTWTGPFAIVGEGSGNVQTTLDSIRANTGVADTGFMKIHTKATFAQNNILKLTIADRGSLHFTARNASFTIA